MQTANAANIHARVAGVFYANVVIVKPILKIAITFEVIALN